MNKLKYLLYFLILIPSFYSCDKGDDYIPMHASSQSNGILLSCVNADGTELNYSDATQNKEIYIWGESSSINTPFEIKAVEYNGLIRNFIHFNADLPDTNHMIFNENENKTEVTGSLIMYVKIQGKKLKLVCTYKFSSSDEQKGTIGCNSIWIDRIEINGKTVEREGNTMNSDIMLNLVNDKSALLIKE